jgi:hypothetical protein
VYELSCYQEAVDGLPEDVRVYSSAADDISRALHARLRSADARATGRGIGDPLVAPSAVSRTTEPPLALMLLVGFVSVFAAVGASCWLVQRRRRGA